MKVKLGMPPKLCIQHYHKPRLSGKYLSYNDVLASPRSSMYDIGLGVKTFMIAGAKPLSELLLTASELIRLFRNIWEIDNTERLVLWS